MRAVLANSRPRLCLAHTRCLLALRRENSADVELGGSLVNLLFIELLVELCHLEQVGEGHTQLVFSVG